MKSSLLPLLALSLVAFNARAQTTRPAEVIVHEWGTFTNFAGSDGVYLDFRPLVDNDLPEFVYDRSMQAQLSRGSAFSKLGVITRTRMETPVTYFYTDQIAELSVRVDLPKGLLTDFYPPVRAMGPAYAKGEKYNPTAGSFLDWGKISVVPQQMVPSDQLQIPKVKGENHYAAARETDSAIVMFTDALRGFRTHEKFLFYRGIGAFQLPLKLISQSETSVQFVSGIPEPIRGAVLVDIHDGKVRFSVQHDLGKEMLLTMPQVEGTVDQLADAVVGLLITDGLYEKEARAMVKTWRTSWFGEDGTRLLYLVPQRVTDEILPLHITPTPKQTVRVMVGRLEMMTAQREAQLSSLVKQMGAEEFSKRDAAYAQIKKMGRFAEPSLQRVVLTSGEPEVRTRAQKLLADIQPVK